MSRVWGSVQRVPAGSAVQGVGGSPGWVRCRCRAVASSWTARSGGRGCPVRVRACPSERRASCRRVTSLEVTAPTAIRVCSTGASDGAGAATARPGRRCRNWLRRRRCSISTAAPDSSAPAPVSPASAHTGHAASSWAGGAAVWAAGADPGDWVAASVAARVPAASVLACGSRAASSSMGVGVLAARCGPSTVAAGGAGAGDGSATGSDARPCDGATWVVDSAAGDGGSRSVQPMSIRSGSLRRTPPGWMMAREAW